MFSGVTITHLQEHKTTVTTAPGNRFTVIELNIQVTLKSDLTNGIRSGVSEKPVRNVKFNTFILRITDMDSLKERTYIVRGTKVFHFCRKLKYYRFRLARRKLDMDTNKQFQRA